MLKKFPTSLSEEEFRDQRLEIINTDPRLYLGTTTQSYDVIMVGFSNQSDLSLNRFFTDGFFALAKDRLNSGGLFSFWLPGSLAYLSQETRDLNRSILNSLKSIFKYVRVIPGDYNIFIASDSAQMLQVEPVLLSERLKKYKVPAGILIPRYLEYRFSPRWFGWHNRQLVPGTKELNRDLRPVAVYESLKIANKKFSPHFARAFAWFDHLNLKVIFFMILAATAVFIVPLGGERVVHCRR